MKVSDGVRDVPTDRVEVGTVPSSPPLIERGEQDSPLAEDLIVQRGCKLPVNFQIGDSLTREIFKFAPSPEEVKLPNPKVSVFVKGMTTYLQLCSLVGNSGDYRIIAFVLVGNVRVIKQGEFGLDVVWDEPTLEDGSADTRDGAEGHAAITGLGKLRGITDGKGITKKLSSDIVDAVEPEIVFITEDNEVKTLTVQHGSHG